MALTQREYCPTACPVCEAPGGAFVPYLRARGPLEIRRCRVCSHLILSVWPPRSSDCPDEFGGIDLNAYIQSMEPERRRGAKTIFTMLKKWKPSAGEFFDVGASFGWLVEEGVNSGWKGSGVDPSAKAVAEAQRRGLDVMLGLFPQDAPAGRKWDVVTITDVVEHLEDPRAIIRDVRERLKEDGLLVVQSPDVTGLLHRTAALLSAMTLGRMTGPLARLWQVQFPYPHLHGFTRRNACRMLEACGFEVLEAVAQPIISGNMAKRAGYTKSSGGLDLVSWVYGLGIGILNAVSALTGRQDLFLVIARRRDG